MPLTIYRRHSVDCRVHKLRLKAYEKKYFKDCDCPVWLKGTTDTEQYLQHSECAWRDGGLTNPYFTASDTVGSLTNKIS